MLSYIRENNTVCAIVAKSTSHLTELMNYRKLAFETRYICKRSVASRCLSSMLPRIF